MRSQHGTGRGAGNARSRRLVHAVWAAGTAPKPRTETEVPALGQALPGDNTVSLPPLVTPAAELTVDEVKRYSRHLIIPEIGMTGQKRLKNASVLCVGAGGPCPPPPLCPC